MAMLKGERIDGYVNINDSVRFNGTVLGMGGGLPKRSHVYYVDGKSGNDRNTGKTWGGAFKTLAKAYDVVRGRIDWAATPWGNYDFIYVAPGSYVENITALPHGAMTIGLGWDMRDGQCGVKIAPASGAPVEVGGFVNGGFVNVGFESADTSEPFTSTILNNCYFENCFFTGAAESVTALAAVLAADCTKTTFKRCWLANAAYGFKFVYADAGDGINYCDIDQCLITGIGTAGIYTSTNLVGPHSVIRNTHIGGGGQTLTYGVDDQSHIFEMLWSTIEASTAVNGALRGTNGSYGNGVLLT